MLTFNIYLCIYFVYIFFFLLLTLYLKILFYFYFYYNVLLTIVLYKSVTGKRLDKNSAS